MLSFVAHPDDDLLFLCPDVADAIRASRPVTTVFLTAGQLSGAGSTDGARYRSRQRGIQDAYAHMAGISPAGDQREWVGELVDVDGRLVERHTLTGHDVHLVWLATPDGQLADLVNNSVPKTTIIPDGGLGAPAYTYRRQDLASAVGALVRLYGGGGVVHSLDPWPESRYTVDHKDHTAAGTIVDEVSPVPVVAHRGYSIGSLPQNLSAAVAADKLATFQVYCAYDPKAAANGWTERMYYRWPRGVSWVIPNADGRLQVLVVRCGTVWTWQQATDGTWPSPTTLEMGGPVAPIITATINADGRLEVFGRRLSDHHLVSTWQADPGVGWAGPADLGNPNAGLSNVAQVGWPSVTRNADGRLQLVVKNGGGGVSTKAQGSAGGSWGSWVDLGGTDVQDVTCVTSPSGRVEVIATTRAGVLRWYQTTTGGALTADTTVQGVAPASPVTLLTGPDGRLCQVYRTTGGQVAVASQPAPGGSWSPPVLSAGPGGVGQVAAVVDSGVVRLYARDAASALSTALVAADGTVGAWATLGGVMDVPAVAVDSTGQLVVFTAADDGQVSAARSGGAWVALP